MNGKTAYCIRPYSSLKSARYDGGMVWRTDEIAEQIYRVSVFVPDAAGGAGFTFNHFLIVGDEPLLFHCGFRKMFPLVSAAIGKIMPLHRIRWLSFGHFEADECGSMNEWLAAAPHAEIMRGMVGCRISIADMADRAPRSQRSVFISERFPVYGATHERALEANLL